MPVRETDKNTLISLAGVKNNAGLIIGLNLLIEMHAGALVFCSTQFKVRDFKKIIISLYHFSQDSTIRIIRILVICWKNVLIRLFCIFVLNAGIQIRYIRYTS